MNFGRGQYVGLLVTDTEYGTDHNRVAGGDVALKQGEHFKATRRFCSSHSRIARRVRRASGTRHAGLLLLQHAALHRCRPARALRPRLPDGHGVHQSRRRDARLAVSGPELLSLASAFAGSSASTRSSGWRAPKDRDAGGHRGVLSAGRAIQLHARRLSARRLRQPATKRSPDSSSRSAG